MSCGTLLTVVPIYSYFAVGTRATGAVVPLLSLLLIDYTYLNQFVRPIDNGSLSLQELLTYLYQPYYSP